MKEWSQQEIEAFTNNHSSGLVYFYTPLCGTCQLAGKMLSVTEELIPGVQIGKADLNYMSGLAELFSIESVPCLLIMKDGTVSEKIYAFHSVSYIYDKIKQTLFT